MIITEELLRKLIGKNVDVAQFPGGHYIQEKRKRGEFIITDIGEQFIEAKSTSSGDTKKYYFNTYSVLRIVLLE